MCTCVMVVVGWRLDVLISGNDQHSNAEESVKWGYFKKKYRDRNTADSSYT